MKIFYRHEMVGKLQQFSPSPMKPGLLIPEWVSRFKNEVEIRSFPPAWASDLGRAHDPGYVTGVLRGEIPNGFGKVEKETTDSTLYTVGSLKTAAEYSFLSKEISCSPTSGFHHAAYSSGGGFCTFNGLVVAAQAVRRRKPTAVVGILDADMHYGDGTADIIQKLGLGWFRHWSVGESWGYRKSDAVEFMEGFSGMVECLLTLPTTLDLLIYQAGADPHIDDPLGGWLTTEQLKKRDQIVFEQCAKHHVPVVWNLAGGYQEPIRKVLDIHTNTLIAALDSIPRVQGMRHLTNAK